MQIWNLWSVRVLLARTLCIATLLCGMLGLSGCAAMRPQGEPPELAVRATADEPEKPWTLQHLLSPNSSMFFNDRSYAIEESLGVGKRKP